MIEPLVSKQWFVNMGDVDGGIVCGKGTGHEFKVDGLAQMAIDVAGFTPAESDELRQAMGSKRPRKGSKYSFWF